VSTPAQTTSLTWSVPPSTGLPIQSYHVFRGSAASNLTQIAVVTQNAYNDTALNPTATYYYAVQAIDTGGDASSVSAIVMAKTQAIASTT
jgi:fibronectin type 3 domain-containing protein